MKRIREWLEETHAPLFELARHFFARFFESDLISTPGQLKVVAASAFGLLFSASFVFTQTYYHKYLELNKLPEGESYRLALIADELFLVTLAMVVMGLFTTIQWPALFPTLQDYLALAALPLRMSRIFAAKFTALFCAAAIVSLATSTLPSIILPAVASGDWATNLPWHFLGIIVSSTLSALFVFLTLIALQGVLLNVLPVRQFPRVSLLFQGALLSALLAALTLVFSIPTLYRSMDLRPEWAFWTPPFWFLGIDQWISGKRDPFAVQLAVRGLEAAAIATFAAVLAYAWSYQRHRRRVLESLSVESAASKAWIDEAGERLLSGARELAVFVFVAKTLARSREHRLILTGFVAGSLAIIFEGFLTLAFTRQGSAWTVESRGLERAAIAVPLALALFVVGGLRYLFRLPVELRANWIFRIQEPGRATELLEGMESFLYFCGLAPVALLTLPLEIAVLGGLKGIPAAILCLLPSMIVAECLLFSFERIPFTSSYLPGRRPLIETVVIYTLFTGVYIWGLASWIHRSLTSPLAATLLGLFLLGGWLFVRRARREWRPLGRLEFEELPDAAVQVLDIDKD